MKVPTIHDLYKSAYKDLLLKEKEIIELKKDPLNSYIISSKETEAFELRVLLTKFKSDLREEKLKQLGI